MCVCVCVCLFVCVDACVRDSIVLLSLGFSALLETFRRIFVFQFLLLYLRHFFVSVFVRVYVCLLVFDCI